MPPVVAFVLTAHGYGHASRQMEVVRALLDRRPDVTAVVLTAAPASVFEDYLGGAPSLFRRVTVVPYRADVGIVQRDALRMDHAATLRALEAMWGQPDRAEAALADVLHEHRACLVVGDIPPVAFGVARRLGVPSVAVGNFDWAFIYRSYAERDPGFAPWAELAARWQGEATVAARLTPGPRLEGFSNVTEGGVIARRLLVDVGSVRERLAIPPGDRTVLVSFGGFGLNDAQRQVPPVPGVTWVLAAPMTDLGRPDTRFVRADAQLPYLSLIAACDAVLTKPGYGIVAEATAHRTRMLYTDRGDFPEYPHLVAWLEDNAVAAHVPQGDLNADGIARGLARLFSMPERWPADADGGERVAALLVSFLAPG